MSFPRYPEYKDSGVEWLGEVPAHWQLMRFKWQIDRNDGGVWGDDPDGEDDTIVLRSTEQTVDGSWRLDDPAARKLTKAEKRSSLLREGDLLVTKSSGSALHIGKTTLVTRDVAALDCCYSNFMQRIRTKASFSPRLAWYVMNNEIARVQFDLASNSTTGLANLNGAMIGELVLTVPSGDEQSAITAFLDHETAKIDALVADQEKLIALLKEKRQAVSTHAVTKGLNTNTPMKDSGVEWLGMVPAHWQIRTISKASVKITNGYVGPISDKLVDFGTPYIQATHIKGGRINFDGDYHVTPEWSEAHGKSILAEGDVLIVQTGAGTGDVGLVSRNEVGFNCHALIIVTSDRSLLIGEFLSAVLQSTFGQEKLRAIRTGAMHPHLNCGEVKYVEIPIPPLSEQFEIVARIRDLANTFDSLRAEVQRAIGLLKERRSALISAAVTGKFDVRGFVAERKAA